MKHFTKEDIKKAYQDGWNAREEAYKKHFVKIKKAYRDKHTEQGLCISCPLPVLGKSTRCEKHLELQRRLTYKYETKRLRFN